ncbi:MAG: hypothetical protein ABFD10_18765 [Prolixibacteraceae bacterium]
MKELTMNQLLKNSILSLTVALLFSCSDEFVNERLDVSGVAESAIIISPSWEADDYQFRCEGTGNSEFSITSKPDWLNTDDNSGSFVNGIATIHCKANAIADYSKTGIYIEQMLVEAGKKTYAVPVYYITEGDPSVQVSRTLEISYSNYNNQLQISNTGNGILLWDIKAMPEWLSVNMDQIDLTSIILGQGATASIPLTLNTEKAIQGNPVGTIMLKTNDKNNPQIAITVSADLGTPKLAVYSYSLPVNFGTSASSKALSFSNNGNGILSWRIEGLPDWLTVLPLNGMSLPYASSTEVVFTCDRTKLEPGLNSATVYLKSNDPDNPSYPISVLVRTPGGNANIRALEGNITDATFDKNTNTLYYVTGQPNKLVAYNVTTKTVSHEIALSKAPTCLAISEDYTKALVGHGGMISTLDLNTNSVTKTVDVTGILADIEFAANDWCTYTESGNYTIQWTNIYWVNLSDGNVTKGSSVYEDCQIKKIPNQDYLIGSETELSAGVYVYDLSNRSEKAEIFESFRDFWVAGDYIVSASGSVYRVSEIISKDGYISAGLSPIGNLQYPGDTYNAIPWIDHCNATHSIFGLAKQDYQTISSQIYQFEDNDYTLVKTYIYDNFYQPDAQTAAYEVEAHYVFANSAGTELSVLRKGKNNTNWSIEFIPVQQ